MTLVVRTVEELWEEMGVAGEGRIRQRRSRAGIDDPADTLPILTGDVM